MFTIAIVAIGIVLGAAGFYAYLRFYYLPRYKEKMLWEHESVKVAALKGGEINAPRELTMREAIEMANEAARRAGEDRRKVLAEYAAEEDDCLCDASGSYKCDCCNGKEMP